MLRKIRIVLATIFFVAITLLFLDFTGTLHSWLGWMAKIQFLPAVLAVNVGVVVALVVMTLLLGRVYCSVICPLGVMQDVIAWLGRRKKSKRNKYSFPPAKNLLRYGVLLLFVVALIAGIGAIVTLLAPYSAYGRIAQNLLSPIWIAANNMLAWIAERADSYAFYHMDIWMRSLPTFVVAAITLVALAVLAWRGGRTYCNTICPVGTVLGFISRYSWLKPVIDVNRCNGCTLCARRCKAACIDAKEHKIDYSRCVACMDCIDNCHQGAISYRHPRGAKKGTPEIDTTRRAVVSGVAIVAATTAVKAQEKLVDGGLATILDKKVPRRATKIVPPGALSVKNLENHCTACQLCVSACPNDVLRPSTNPSTFMQVESSYERGYCRPECTACSEVCPTGAIRPITEADKAAIQVGHAVWVKENCVVLTDEVDCGHCASHCPTGAITMIQMTKDDSNSPYIPAVDTERCIGCGACENLCPARPYSAIYVEGHEVHRKV